jgi:pyruvate dehydrogenase kinase 2/3/4
LHACPMQIIRHAVEDATVVCARELAFTPSVRVRGDEDATFAFLPSHLHHIIFELVKNSMRAVVERHSGAGEDAAPSIDIVLSHDASEFAVRVSDQGGGIPRRDLHRIWSYLYTTIEHSGDEDRMQALESNQLERMAGWGYGLPLSRLYAKFFGGDLEVMSMPDYGTDCYLYLSRALNEQLFLD